MSRWVAVPRVPGPVSTAGDLLLAADAAELAGVDALHRLLTAERIGKSVALRLLRGREIMTIGLRA